MKQTIFVAAGLATILAVLPVASDAGPRESEITNHIRRFLDAYSTGDQATVLHELSPDVKVYGSDVSETFRGLAGVRRIMDGDLKLWGRTGQGRPDAERVNRVRADTLRNNFRGPVLTPRRCTDHGPVQHGLAAHGEGMAVGAKRQQHPHGRPERRSAVAAIGSSALHAHRRRSRQPLPLRPLEQEPTFRAARIYDVQRVSPGDSTRPMRD